MGTANEGGEYDVAVAGMFYKNVSVFLDGRSMYRWFMQ